MEAKYKPNKISKSMRTAIYFMAKKYEHALSKQQLGCARPDLESLAEIRAWINKLRKELGM